MCKKAGLEELALSWRSLSTLAHEILEAKQMMQAAVVIQQKTFSSSFAGPMTRKNMRNLHRCRSSHSVKKVKNLKRIPSSSDGLQLQVDEKV